ncbi:MAG: glycerol kinase GlpK [Luteibaculaceae bacterium]
MHYILALDAGTTSCRAVLYDERAKLIDLEKKEFKSFFPQQGYVEQDPEEIWQTQLEIVQILLERNKNIAASIVAVGITNQRETVIAWDKETGKSIGNAIVWQDNRTQEFCEVLKERGLENTVKERTGLLLNSYFSATKMCWILDNVPRAKELEKENRLLFGTVDTWLIYKLTKGKRFVTDVTNASRTMLFNINTGEWDNTLLKELEIKENCLPSVLDSNALFGTVDSSFFGFSIPIHGVLGDQQAALFGQCCFNLGDAKNTYGTGCFMLMNTGEKPVYSTKGLLTTMAWRINGENTYALEGSVFIAGAAVQWLRDGLKIIDNAFDSEYFASKVSSSEGVVVVPAFNGLGAPYWDSKAKGAIFGLSMSTTKAHLIRATLESLAYQTKDVLEAMQSDSKIALEKLFVDGGASVNYLLLQFQSDILGKTVCRPKNVESTSAGAAYMAGLGAGIYTLEELVKLKELDKVFKPRMPKQQREKLYANWLKAVERSKAWD